VIIPLSIGVSKLASQLNIAPSYTLRASKIKSMINGYTAIPNFRNGTATIHFVGKDKTGSLYNLFSMDFAISTALGMLTHSIGFRGLPDFQAYPWYYINPQNRVLVLEIEKLPLASITETTTYEWVISGRSLTIKRDGSVLFTTTFFKDPLTIDEIYTVADAYDTGGSPITGLTGFALLNLDVIQSFDISTILPIVVFAGVVASVVATLLTLLSKLSK